jgi:hypothetical protein
MKRRNFNRLLGGGAIAIPLTALTTHRAALADDMPMVDPESTTAKALQYMVESDKEQNCEGCILYQAKEGADNGLCSIFPEQLVPAKAWCSAFQPKPG